MIELTESIMNYNTLELNLSNINRQIIEAEHKLAVSELNYTKCSNMYYNSNNDKNKNIHKYVIKYKMEKMECENELNVLLDEYQQTLKQMMEIYEEDE